MVTGATSGLGEAAALALAGAGWQVFVVGRDPARGAATVAKARAAGGTAEFVGADLFALADVRRLAGAFHETGRGLLVGVGLTGLVQGVVATITYVALSIPSALVLGILTTVASLLPSVGTALVWIPVAGGLAFSGRYVAAGILTAVGVLVIGTVDNVMRPVFSRFGRLNLPTYVLFLAIFGGLAFFGAAGLLLGPLLVRLGVEALAIARDEGWTASPSGDTPAADSEGAAATVAGQQSREGS